MPNTQQFNESSISASIVCVPLVADFHPIERNTIIQITFANFQYESIFLVDSPQSTSYTLNA